MATNKIFKRFTGSAWEEFKFAAFDSEKLGGVLPSGYALASHNHTIANVSGLQTALDGKAEVTHKYHNFSNGQYFFDTYEQGNNLRLFTETASFDQFRFQAISNVEYYNGTSWLPWAGGDANIKLLLDGREETGFNVTHTHRRFRFTVQRSGAWPTLALLVLQETWTGLNHPNTTITIETWNGTAWILKDTTVFGAGTTGNGLGIHMKATSTVHDGIANTRVTVLMDDWTDNGSYTEIPLRRLMFLSNFNGGVIHPWTWSYDKTVSFGNTPRVNGTALVLTNDSRLSDARTPTAHTLDSHTGSLSISKIAPSGTNNYVLKTVGGAVAWAVDDNTTYASGTVSEATTGTETAQRTWSPSILKSAIQALSDIDTNNYLTGVSGSGNGTVTFARNGLADLTWDASHTHAATAINVGGISVIGKSDAGGGTTQELGMPTLKSMLGLGSAAYTASTAYRPSSYVPSWSEVTSKPTFATVATSGSYDDLSNKPTIPTIPSVMDTTEGNTGTATTQRTINALNLKAIILNHSPAGARAASSIDTTVLGTSTPSASTFLAGDRQWKSIAFSALTGTAVAGQIPTLAISKIDGLQTELNGKLSTSGTAADSSKLNGQIASYYQAASTAITTSNISSQSVASAVTASSVTNGVYTTGDQTIGGTKTFSGSITVGANIIGNSSDGYIQYFSSSTIGPKIQGKYTAEERYLSLTADDIKLYGTVKINGSGVSLAGHTHTYADLTGTVPTWNQSTTGNAATATTAVRANAWTTARTLTIGSSAQSIDGSGNVTYTLAGIGAAATSHTHGDISSTGLISAQTAMGTGDAILLADSSASGKVIKSNITLDTTNTTQYLRRDGAWAAPAMSAPVTSVNGYTGAVNTVDNTITTSTVNTLVYGVLQGSSVVRISTGTRLKIDTGFYNPQGGSTGNSVTFNVAFAQRPAVFAFPVRAGSTTATILAAKATVVSTTGATFISSFISSSATYTPSNSNETYCWVAIGY